MKKIVYLVVFLLSFSLLQAQVKGKKRVQMGRPGKGTLQLVFRNMVNGRPLVLNDSSYSNPSGESFTISKLKYYISHSFLGIPGGKNTSDKGYYLINQQIDSSLTISFTMPENSYDRIGFLAGVDSIRNTNGAQTGALDPLNDMFWTWNTGYIMFKLEGKSSQSKVVNSKVEYHLGGFKGENSVLNNIALPLPAGQLLKIKKGKTTVVMIDVNLDQLWQGNLALKISDTPVCSSPGLLARQIAGNFSKAFTVTAVVNGK